MVGNASPQTQCVYDDDHRCKFPHCSCYEIDKRAPRRRGIGAVGWLAIAILFAFAIAFLNTNARGDTYNPRSGIANTSKSRTCTALEALGRWAQAKINAGHQPTAAQRATADRKIAWYQANCR